MIFKQTDIIEIIEDDDNLYLYLKSYKEGIMWYEFVIDKTTWIIPNIISNLDLSHYQEYIKPEEPEEEIGTLSEEWEEIFKMEEQFIKDNGLEEFYME